MNAYSYSTLSDKERQALDSSEQISNVVDETLKISGRLEFLNYPQTRELIKQLEFTKNNIYSRLLNYCSNNPTISDGQFRIITNEVATLHKVLNLIKNGKYEIEAPTNL